VRSRTRLADPRVDYRAADFEAGDFGAGAVGPRIGQAESRADHGAVDIGAVDIGTVDIVAVDIGAVDIVAGDERDALRLARLCVRRLNRSDAGWGGAGWDGSTGFGAPPRYDQDELLGLASAEPREILARLLDDSGFDEFQPGYGAGLVAGWGALHGYPLGVLAGSLGGHTEGQRAAQKAARFVRRANSTGTPLLFLDSGGVDDPMVVQAVATSAVPHLTLNIGGGGGMCGRAYRPRFLFSWPRAGALELSGRLYDDGVIDPRDTRTALGIALSVAARRAQ
jgi:acetyl-CoA carboxylase carboxyltransferase component